MSVAHPSIFRFPPPRQPGGRVQAAGGAALARPRSVLACLLDQIRLAPRRRTNLGMSGGSLTTRWLLALAFGLLAGPALAAAGGTIALYHHVAEDTPASTSISPAAFRGHLEYLRDEGFTVVPLNEMVTAARTDGILPEKAVAITFDDGYSSIFDTAFPLLQEFAMPFTVFVSTEAIDRGLAAYMNWDQLRELSEAGVLLANHTVSHAHLLEGEEGETEAERLARARQEILTAEQRISEETGQAWRYFAYPYGEFDPALRQLLEELDFTGFAQRSGAVGPHSDFLALPRFPLAGPYANLDTARTKFAALALDMQRVEPESPVTAEASPAVTVRFGAGNYAFDGINCFAGGEAFPLEWVDREAGLARLAPERTFTGRRWLYTCTARAADSPRYFWHSLQWINPQRPE